MNRSDVGSCLRPLLAATRPSIIAPNRNAWVIFSASTTRQTSSASCCCTNAFLPPTRSVASMNMAVPTWNSGPLERNAKSGSIWRTWRRDADLLDHARRVPDDLQLLPAELVGQGAALEVAVLVELEALGGLAGARVDRRAARVEDARSVEHRLEPRLVLAGPLQGGRGVDAARHDQVARHRGGPPPGLRGLDDLPERRRRVGQDRQSSFRVHGDGLRRHRGDVDGRVGGLEWARGEGSGPVR